MYKDAFNKANNTIKMSDDLKDKIRIKMQHSIRGNNSMINKINTFLKRRVVIAIATITLLLSGTTAYAISSGLAKDIYDFFTMRKGIVEANSNFLSRDDLAALGEDMNLTATSGSVKAHLQTLMADEYCLYGIFELEAPEYIKFNDAHYLNEVNNIYVDINIDNPDNSPFFYSGTLTYYKLKDEDVNDNKITIMFGISMNKFDSEPLNYVLPGKFITISKLGDLGHQDNCEECNMVYRDLNQYLQTQPLKFKIPNTLKICNTKITLSDTYNVKSAPIDMDEENNDDIDVSISQIQITPFSIRFFEDIESFPSVQIIFKDGYTLDDSHHDIDKSVSIHNLGSNPVTEYVGEFLNPINIDKIDAIKIGGTEIKVN